MLTFQYGPTQELARLCLDNKLYLFGIGVMSNKFRYLLTPRSSTSHIAVAFDNSLPVASVLIGPLSTANEREINVYVHETHRKQGVATRLIDYIVAEANLDREELVSFSFDRDHEFWRKNGIYVRNYRQGYSLTSEELQRFNNGEAEKVLTEVRTRVRQAFLLPAHLSLDKTIQNFLVVKPPSLTFGERFDPSSEKP